MYACVCVWVCVCVCVCGCDVWVCVVCVVCVWCVCVFLRECVTFIFIYWYHAITSLLTNLLGNQLMFITFLGFICYTCTGKKLANLQ
jgi:hypothetical protein